MTARPRNADTLPGHLEQQAKASLAELRAHRDQPLGVINQEQTESARYHRKPPTQQKRIEVLLGELSEPRLQMAATGGAPAAPAPERRLLGGTADLIPPAFAWSAHVTILRKAAAVHTPTAECNPHTWEFLTGQVTITDGPDAHFTTPDDRLRGRERERPAPEKPFTTELPGRSAVALLNALHRVAHRGVDQPHDIETWPLAITAYERIAAVVATAAPRDGNSQPGFDNNPHAVLDDRTTN
ncbi:hypothetical protein ACIA8O_26850 [Kitasatospora sp. NPDC051853]|uniref:hypothetical protein n=1 Tax=Kitasatospora sp. NPDC051853 TaxID=3364058 RepID=UPI0037A1BE3F